MSSLSNMPQRMEMALPIGSLNAYVHQINQIPMLTEAEEIELTHRFYEKGDLEAAKRLVMSHLRFVVSVARKYSGYGLPQADLIQEGNLGLMKAVKRFNPAVGVRLVSFAIHWIRAEIHEFILRNWKIVKVATTKTQRKLFFNLRKASKKLGYLSNQEKQDIAENLGVDTKDVEEMSMRLYSVDESFDPIMDSEDEGYYQSPSEYLSSSNRPDHFIEHADQSDIRKKALYSALATLDERSQNIITRRWLNDEQKKPTLSDLAKEYNVSLERVRQIEKAAMNKIKSQFPLILSTT